MHQGPSSRGQPTLQHECVPRREEHLRNGCGVGYADDDRNPHQLSLVRGDLLGVGTTGLDPHHLVTGFPHRDPLADGIDGSGELQPGYLERRRSRVRVHAHRLQEVGTVQCSCPHAHHARRRGHRADPGCLQSSANLDHHETEVRQHASLQSPIDAPETYGSTTMRTTPATGSTSIRAPSGMSVSAPRAPTTAGIPSSRARTAAWLSGPPSAVTTAPAKVRTEL